MQIGERAYQSFSPEIRESRDGNKTVINISTESVDRHGTIIDVRGVNLDAFKRNPVVLFNHDYDKVVGRASNIQVRGSQLVAEVEWDEEDPFAAEVARKMRAGFLNAASVGFLIEDGADDAERGAFVISRSELVEFSIVAVPSNRDALVLSRDLRQQVKDLQDSLEQIKAARQAPAEPAEDASEADQAEPAEPAAEAVPEPEAAKPEPEQVASASPQPARSATASDYGALAKALQPVIAQSVLRALGKA